MRFVKQMLGCIVTSGLMMLGGCLAKDAYEASKDPYVRAKVKRKFNKLKDVFRKDEG